MLKPIVLSHRMHDFGHYLVPSRAWLDSNHRG